MAAALPLPSLPGRRAVNYEPSASWIAAASALLTDANGPLPGACPSMASARRPGGTTGITLYDPA